MNALCRATGIMNRKVESEFEVFEEFFYPGFRCVGIRSKVISPRSGS